MSQHGLNFLSGKKQQLPQEEGSGHENSSEIFSHHFQASFRGMQLLTETHLMSPVWISSPSKWNSLLHHWVLWMQGMRCLGQVQNVEGLESPGNIPLLSPVLPGSWWMWMGMGGSSLDTALSSFLVVPGQKMLLFVRTWQIQFPWTQQKRSEPTNSCNNSGKCRKNPKEWNSSWSKWCVSFQKKCLHQENWVSSKLQIPHLCKAGIWFSILSSSSLH